MLYGRRKGLTGLDEFNSAISTMNFVKKARFIQPNKDFVVPLLNLEKQVCAGECE